MAHITEDRIKETSTSTGTGALTLAGAMLGYRAASSKCAVGDTLFYVAEAVDAGGALTGEWECGLGTYSGANTLTRTTVTSSSNADAPVAFAAGTKHVYLAFIATQARWARERLTANRTYYVRTDGSDSNTGLANTAGGAFLTIQKAIDVVSSTLDTSIYNVTIQVADGTYAASNLVAKNAAGAGSVTIQGNSGTPANVVVNITTGTVFTAVACTTRYIIKDFKVTATTSGQFLLAQLNSVVDFSNIEIGAGFTARQIQATSGAIVTAGSYTISGGSSYHLSASTGAVINVFGITVTLTGTPAFSAAYAEASRGGYIVAYSATFSGSATGPRYTAVTNAVIDTSGGGATYLPGNAAHGTPTATGGQYA